jgi:hypothetical protein
LNVVPTLLNATDVTPMPPVNPVPTTLTIVPGGPLAGENEVTVGAAATAGPAPTTSSTTQANATIVARCNERARAVI